MTEEREKMSTKRKVLIGLISAFVALAIAIYAGGVFYFKTHFLPGSKVNGIDCSFLSEERAQEYMEKEVSVYTLAIDERNDGREKLEGSEIGLTYVPDGGIAELLSQQKTATWVLSLPKGEKHQLDTGVTYDLEKLEEKMLSLNCFQEGNITAPQDASIQETDTGYEIVPEVIGDQLDRDKTLRALQDAVDGQQRELDLEEAGCYVNPKVYQDDKTLRKHVRQMNKLVDVVVTYDFDDRTETVDKDVIKNWLVLDKKGNYTLDKERVAAYVNQLGYDYDTFGCTHDFVTALGEKIRVKGGDYGWAIDQDKETAALIKVIKSGETQIREPVYAFEGWDRKENDIGDTYVEISLKDQRMWMYKDGQLLVDTLVVTGNHSKGWDTPAGVYAVDAKKSPAVLTGEDYASDVTFWLPFNGNVGIHDADWRTEFGGDLYLTEGSHGCVNTPYDQAEIIYNNIEIGAPVVVY